METTIWERFNGKSVVILGFGREGQAVYLRLRQWLPDLVLTIADRNEKISENSLFAHDSFIRFKTGQGYLEGLDLFDVIVRSPGIPVWNLKDSQGNRMPANLIREKITTQTELFLEIYGKQVIGVTGTKGKSTTSTLISHILKEAGFDVILAGNIGNPVFHIIDQITPKTMIVLELSSHQLEFLKRGPHISVFLNLFQEHLDAYESYEAYQQAKLNIIRFQLPGDFSVINADDPLVCRLAEPFRTPELFSFSMNSRPHRGCWKTSEVIMFNDGYQDLPVWRTHQDRFLRGEHNLKNIMAAITVCMILGVEKEVIEDGIGTFKGLEHRLEYVGEYGGIHCYNDSIATIPEACIEAVKSLPLVDTLVAGGFDRGIDYTALGEFLAGSAIRNLILTGDAGRRIGEAVISCDTGKKSVFYIHRFDEFAVIAAKVTAKGHVCLLSPAAASYDEFSNFEERGKRYRELVRTTFKG
jgi:UDP-N-acetylmuramoylalanine--D-glutamate ligase